jgi:hypothetical protein
MTLVIYHDPVSNLPAVDIDGEMRLLAALPTPIETRLKFKQFREAHPLVPRQDWQGIDRSQVLRQDFILNQKSHGSCVGFAATGSMMRCRALAGQTFQRLSGAFVYSWINGGRDNGSSIGDSLDTLLKYGTCLESEADWDKIYPNRIPKTAYQTAYRFRCEEGYRADSFEEFMSGIQLGYIGVYAVMVGGSFDNLDGESICGFDRGSGNHAIASDGCYKSNSKGWCIDAYNSWGTNWGNNGRMRTTEQMFNSVYQDAYLIRAVTWDPLDENKLPSA